MARVANLTLVDVSEPGLPRFLVEWYGQRANAGAIADAAERLSDGGASTSAGDAHIRLLMALAIPTDDYAFGVFAADSADTVERVCARAGAPPDRISAAVDACAVDH